MNKTFVRLLSIFIIISLSIQLSAEDIASPSQKKVMVICSHSETSPWSMDMMKPIVELENERTDYYYITNFLRMTSLQDSEELQLRKQNMISSMNGDAPDIVVLIGGSSYLMVDALREAWPEVPFILAGETDYICPEEYTIRGEADPNVPKKYITEDYASEKNLTLLQTPLCIEQEVELARNLFPKMSTMLFIAGENYQSRQQQIILEKYMQENYPEVDTEILLSTDMSTDDLIEEIMAHTNDETAIIYGAWLRHDGYQQHIVTRNNVLRLLEGYAPIISMSAIDFSYNPDVVGYCSYDHEKYSSELKRRIVEILDLGKEARDIAILELDAISTYVYSSALDKFGLTYERHSSDYITMRSVQTTWQKHKYWIMFYILMTILITAVILASMSFRLARQRKNDNNKLSALMDELKTANEAAESARKEALLLKETAEKASAMKSKFIQNMSHDVRTPLNAIVGFSQLLSLPDGMISDEEKIEYQSFISNNANVLMMLVDDVLNLSDVESGNYKISKAPGPCNELCRHTIKSVEYRVQPGVELTFTSDVEDSFQVNTDERRVQQVLTNFLTNACKHTFKGSINLHCRLSEDKNSVQFLVTDTGEGIPAEKAEKIFERFTKLDAYVEGAGIGLNICTTIASNLGGEVSLDKTYSDGARFILTIPC
ncbi:MAG: HAMP domain-containing histidine kinase [Bacteroidales bacterium]|nr:HAMP domain-containing histidine kinase [Bacteroidales bacterium]